MSSNYVRECNDKINGKLPGHDKIKQTLFDNEVTSIKLCYFNLKIDLFLKQKDAIT